VQLDRQGEHQTRDAMERAWWAVRLCAFTVLLWLVMVPFCLGLLG
jgi:type II secretory pathway component PulL